jgi:predicted DNA-binding transcriptional regulator AlpA
VNDRVLNPEQLAKEFLNIKLGTLYSHISRGTDLPPSFKIGSQTRWRESQVLVWIEKKEKERKQRNFED